MELINYYYLRISSASEIFRSVEYEEDSNVYCFTITSSGELSCSRCSVIYKTGRFAVCSASYKFSEGLQNFLDLCRP
jgi:hypothetical protein